MRNFSFCIFIIWTLSWVPSTLFGQGDSADAVIENEKIVTSFDFSRSDQKMSHYKKTITINRRVRINSLLGLENLNKLYIPTFKDLDYSYNLLKVSAKTIKANGEEFTIDPDNMQKTTLPGNLIYLYGFEGSVLQFAFENVQVGDVIEYAYTMAYETSQSYKYWLINDEQDVSGEYPILKGEYIFKLQKKVDGLFAISNSNNDMVWNKENNTYSVKFENIEALTDESYSVDNERAVYIKYKINTDGEAVLSKSWSDYFYNSLSKTKGREYFFGGIQMRELIKEGKSINAGAYEKVDAIINYLEKSYKEEPYAVYKFNQSYNVDFVDAKNLIHLLQEIEVDAHVIFVRNKFNGPFLKDFYSLSQFNSLVVLFKDNNGEERYWEPFAPFNRIDQISYQYQGTKGLELSKVKNKAVVGEAELPSFSSEKNKSSRMVDVDIIRSNNNLKFNVEEKVILGGENASDDYLGFYLEKIDSSLTFYSDYKVAQYNARFPNCEVDTIILDELIEANRIGFTIKYSYSNPFSDDYDQIIIEVQDLIGKIVFAEVDRTRKSKAVFAYPFTIENIFRIKSEAEVIRENKFLTGSFSNKLVSFSRMVEIDGSNMRLDIKYNQKVGLVFPENWSSYLEAMDAVFSYYNQKILLEYK